MTTSNGRPDGAAPTATSPDPTSPEPQDEFERALVETREGRAPVHELIGRLLSTRVCVLLNKEIPESGVWPPGTSPLLVGREGGAEYVAVFSNLARAGHVATQVPSHSYCLVVSASWLVASMSPELGLALNPGFPVAFEMPPDLLEGVRREIELAAPA